ncbi:MAG: hypothetical protein WDW38_008415 [Sanguina aurantia]
MGSKVQPDFTGDALLSRVANWMTSTPWIYDILKIFARRQIISLAVSKGIDWEGHVKQMEATSEIYAIKSEVEDVCVSYPAYYLKPFHAYTTGNLSWQAAFEVDPASDSVALRCYKMFDTLSPKQAQDMLRDSITNSIKAHLHSCSIPAPSHILDVGCSTGISSRYMAAAWPQAHVTGIDLSPYFLAVAEWQNRRCGVHQALAGQGPSWSEPCQGLHPPHPPPAQIPNPITYRHASIEECALPSASYDLLNFTFVIHECPADAIRGFIAQSKRLLVPGRGIVSFVDNDPRSAAIQSMPPAVAVFMKSTEPWSDSYYSMDLEGALAEAGFTNITSVSVDTRHRNVMAVAPPTPAQ